MRIPHLTDGHVSRVRPTCDTLYRQLDRIRGNPFPCVGFLFPPVKHPYIQDQTKLRRFPLIHIRGPPLITMRSPRIRVEVSRVASMDGGDVGHLLYAFVTNTKERDSHYYFISSCNTDMKDIRGSLKRQDQQVLQTEHVTVKLLPQNLRDLKESSVWSLWRKVKLRL